jgi:hypothetical protein
MTRPAVGRNPVSKVLLGKCKHFSKWNLEFVPDKLGMKYDPPQPTAYYFFPNWWSIL